MEDDKTSIIIGAPVVITTNHSKRKYKEDGIFNGARGYVQAIQTAKNDQDKVEIVWVVFNNENIGKLYRHDHSYLRKEFHGTKILNWAQILMRGPNV